MKKITFLFLLLPFIGLCQVQIGSDIIGQDNLDQAGKAISISTDGTLIAVGSPGSDGDNVGGNLAGQVRVFENINNVWTQIGQDINGEEAVNRSGENLSLSADGNIVAIGAANNSNNGNFEAGHVRVFENISGTWTQIGDDIDGLGSNDNFGRCVDLSSDGSILAVGGDGGGFKGYVNIYENVNGSWMQIGDSILGQTNGDGAGFSNNGGAISLSPDGTTIIIGSESHSGIFQSAGHVRVFENINGIWTQKGQNIEGDGIFNKYGGRVTISPNNMFIAAATTGNTETTLFRGFVKVHQYINNDWVQVGQTLAGEDNYNDFGQSLSLSTDGSLLASSASGFNMNTGKTYVYKNINNTWVLLGTILGDNTSERSGYSIDISLDTSIFAIGSPSSTNNPIPNGRVRVFNIDELLLSVPAFIEVIDDIAGNSNGINVTANQLNSIIGVSGAVEGINYTTALDNGTFVDENNPTAAEIQLIIDQVNATLSISDKVSFEFKLYPNPTKTQFTIELDPSVELEQVTIYNTLGQEMLTSEERVVDTSQLSSGSYIVEITTNLGKSSKNMIIK